MKKTYTSYDELPLALSADEIAQVLGISRSRAYELLHSKGFPTLKLNKRLVVMKDKLLVWIEEQTAA
jgi:excisionase family DNA binding protein